MTVKIPFAAAKELPAIVTVAPLVKFVPVSVTLSPPLAIPEFAAMVARVGAAGSTSPTPNKSIPEGIAVLTSNVAVLSPVDVGEKATVTVAVCNGASEDGRPQLVITNWLAFAPVREHAEVKNVNGDAVVLVTLIVCGAVAPLFDARTPKRKGPVVSVYGLIVRPARNVGI